MQRRSIGSRSASRTRTLNGNTKALEALPTTHTDEHAYILDEESLDGAQGVRRYGASTREEAKAKPTHHIVLILLLAVLVFVGSFIALRSCMQSLSGSNVEQSELFAATDAYSAFALVDTDDQLESVYLGYTDSINARFELIKIDASIRGVSVSGATSTTLRELYASSGVSGLVSAMSALADVDIACGIVVTNEQMQGILSLVYDDGTAQSDDLARQLASANSHISLTTLLGLLRCVDDVDSTSFVQMEAPVDTTEDNTTQILNQPSWFTMVKGMRDTTSDVTLGM